MHRLTTMLLVVGLIGGAMWPSAGPALAAKAFPVDEASKDPALKAVRDRLLAAVRKRNVNATLALMSTDVKLSLGDDAGHARFRIMVGRSPDLWKALEWALRHGGRFGGNGAWFAAPYTAEAKLGKIEPFDALIVIARGVPLRQRPNAKSRIVARLSYDVVEMLEEPGKRGAVWRKVEAPDGRIGWVHKRFTRSPVEYRVVFRKIGGEWLVVSFLAGD